MRVRTRMVALAGIGCALLLPAAAGARPVDVVVINSPTVKLDSSANTVKLASGAPNPVVPQLNVPFSATTSSLSVTGSAGSCTSPDFDIPKDRGALYLDAVYVDFAGLTLANAPRGGIRVLRRDEAGNFTAIDLPVPITAANGFGGPGGFLPLTGIVIQPAPTFNEVLNGTFYGVETCLNRGTGGTGTTADVLLIGHFQPG